MMVLATKAILWQVLIHTHAVPLLIATQEYSDSEEEPDVDLENQYYNSKALKEEEPMAALSSFELVLDLEEDKGEWGFKALKQMMKLRFRLVRLSS